MGQAQNLPMGHNGPGQSIKIWDGTRDGTITIFLAKSGTAHGTGRDMTITIFWQNLGRLTGRDNHYFFCIISCFRTSFPVLGHLFLF